MRPFDPALLRRVPATRGPLAALSALGVVGGMLAVAQAVVLAWAVAAVATGAPVRVPVLTLLALLVARGVTAGASEQVTTWAAQRVSAAVRSTVVRHWLGLPEGRRPDAATAATRATEGIAAIEPYVARYLPALVTGVVVPVLAVATLAVVDLWSAVIVVLTLPLMPVFAALIGRHTQDETERRWAALTTLAGHFLDVVRGLPTLVAYGRADYQAQVVAEVGERHRRATVRTLRTAFLSTAALELLATISVAMVAVAVGLRLAVGWMDLQVALTAILLAPEAYWPVRRVGAEFHNAADGAAALESLAGDLDDAGPRAGDQDRRAPHAEELPLTGGPVTATGLGYAYPGRPPVLQDLHLVTPPGPALTALTGPSGCGKSTLLDLLAGLREPLAGTVSAPGPVFYATQRPLLVPGSVLDNLLLAAPEVTGEQAQAALASVGLWPDLAERAGLDTPLGDDGFGLSAGQRARLALARARVSGAPVVLLDEPTAHVEAADVPVLHELLLDLAARRTVVVATHDPVLVAIASAHWVLHPVRDEAREAGPGLTAGASPGPELPLADVPGPAVDTDPVEPTPPAGPPPSAARLLPACLLGGLSTACGVALTATSGWLIVQASFQPVILTLLVAIVGVRAFGIGRPLLRYAERVLSHDVALADLARRRVAAYRELVPLTPARLGRRARGDVLTAVVRDLDDVADATARVTVPLWGAAIASTVAVALVALVLPAAAGSIALGAVAAFALGRLGESLELRQQAAAVAARGRVHRVTASVAGQIGAYRAVLAGRTARALGPLALAQHDQAAAVSRTSRVRALVTAAAWVVLASTAGAVTTLAAAAFAADQLSAPLAALVALTPMALADTWVALPETFGARARAAAARSRLDQLLGQGPAVTDPGPGAALPPRDPAKTAYRSGRMEGRPPAPIELVGAAAMWADAGPFDLDPLDLRLAAGDRVLLTGPNGCGKSTALAVLARHLEPVAGRYLQDGTDVRALRVAAARARVAVVDDEPHVFAGTVRANLVLARPTASDAEVAMALRSAGLGQWLAALPDGLDTALTGLSGGERARLAIARAVLSGRDVLLLDEPAAHLDAPTSRAVLADLLAHAGSRALLMVSHEPPERLEDAVEWRVIDLGSGAAGRDGASGASATPPEQRRGRGASRVAVSTGP